MRCGGMRCSEHGAYRRLRRVMDAQTTPAQTQRSIARTMYLVICPESAVAREYAQRRTPRDGNPGSLGSGDAQSQNVEDRKTSTFEDVRPIESRYLKLEPLTLETRKSRRTGKPRNTPAARACAYLCVCTSTTRFALALDPGRTYVSGLARISHLASHIAPPVPTHLSVGWVRWRSPRTVLLCRFVDDSAADADVDVDVDVGVERSALSFRGRSVYSGPGSASIDHRPSSNNHQRTRTAASGTCTIIRSCSVRVSSFRDPSSELRACDVSMCFSPSPVCFVPRSNSKLGRSILATSCLRVSLCRIVSATSMVSPSLSPPPMFLATVPLSR